MFCINWKKKKIDQVLFKKKSTFFENQKFFDPIETELVYLEAVNYVVGGKFPVSEEQAVLLAGIQLQIKFGDFNPTKDILNLKSIVQYFPKDIFTIQNYNSPQQQGKVLDQIKANWINKSGSSIVDLRKTYLAQLTSWEFYGSVIFAVEQRRKPLNILIAISSTRVLILNKHSIAKDVLNFWSWKDIQSWRDEPNNSFHVKAGSLVKLIQMQFSTIHPKCLSHTMDDFFKALQQTPSQQPPQQQQIEQRKRGKSVYSSLVKENK